MEKKELKEVREFLKNSVVLLNNVLLYSMNHSKTKEILFKPYNKLLNILRINNKFTVSVLEGEMLVEKKSLGLAGAINAKLVSVLKGLKIHDITFKDGITKEEWKKFIEILITKTEKVDNAGGINNLLNTLKIKNISANDMYFIEMPKDEALDVPKGKKEIFVKEKSTKDAAPSLEKKEEAPPAKKVLIAEDDEEERELFSDVVKKCNFAVLEAPDGSKALELIKGTKDIDLIILDIKLPKIHGLEILTHLKKMKRQIPVIVCTAYSGLKDDAAVTFYPKIITMDKPVSLKELEENIKKMLES